MFYQLNMSLNLSEAPILTLKDKIEDEISKECQMLLDKYFEGREYNREKVNLWKNYTMDELSNFLTKNYKDYGFCVFVNIIKKGDIRINSNGLFRKDTDSSLFKSVETKSLFIEIRIRYYKLYKNNMNLSNVINEELVKRMNNMLNNKLEGKFYSYEFAKKTVADIVVELENFLLLSENRPCTFQICNILSKPIEHQFSYKIINLDYLPLIASYSNDHLYAQLILFLLGN